MTQALEQLLGNTRNYTGLETHATIDTYAAGTTALYSFEAPKPIGSLPQPPITPINPILDGGVYIDFPKSTPNTTIIKEKIGGDGGLENIYIHHDRGPGRIDGNY